MAYQNPVLVESWESELSFKKLTSKYLALMVAGMPQNIWTKYVDLERIFCGQVIVLLAHSPLACLYFPFFLHLYVSFPMLYEPPNCLSHKFIHYEEYLAAADPQLGDVWCDATILNNCFLALVPLHWLSLAWEWIGGTEYSVPSLTKRNQGDKRKGAAGWWQSTHVS